ncbi:MAG TPA: tetratricopeptide repeat protein, partial [Candidatus Obscuribacterales bacterium]
IYDQVYGQNNILTLNTRATLAAAEFRAGNLNKAAELYRQALGQGQSSLKPNSMETARILNELAYLYFRQGKFDESLTFYQWALASTEGAAGKDSPLTAACLKDYAQVLRSAGRTSDAAIIESRADKISSAGQ